MIGWLIVACEIGFWLFVLSGMLFRYVLKKPKMGAVLLICTPIVDLLLLLFTAIDLRNGAEANLFHGLAAVYLGVTVVYGKSMIRWADERFAYRFAGGPKPAPKPRYGSEHARLERAGWVRHLFSWAIGVALLFGMILWVGIHQTEQIAPLLRMASVWTLVLVIDFFISFSYTLWPRKEPKSRLG